MTARTAVLHSATPEPTELRRRRDEAGAAAWCRVDAVADRRHRTADETDPTTGHWAYRDASLLVGRQCGKSTMALILLLIQCFATPGTTCVYGAQTLKDSRAMLLETWKPLLDSSPLVDTYTVREANGSERIMFKNKSSIQLLTTTSTKAGHGRTITYAILDEAFSQPDARVEQAVLQLWRRCRSTVDWAVSTS